MNNFPYSYESINLYNGHISPTGKVQCDQTTFYFWRALWHRLLAVFRFDLPEGWNKNYFENVLFGCGFIGIVDTEKYGVIPQLCSLTGFGLYLQPTELIVSQPLVQFRGTIGEDCEVFKLTPDYLGILDIVDHYAKQLANIYTSVNVASENSRAALIAFPKTKAAAETLKVLAERISAGESLVLADKILKEGVDQGESLFLQAYDVASNYIGSELLENLTTIINSFDREIGIPIIDDKRERRIVTEVKTMISDSGARLSIWKECLDDSIERVKRLFDIDISYSTIADDIPTDSEGVEE